MTAPWGLDFVADEAPGLDVTVDFDDITSRLQVRVKNTGAVSLSPAEVRLTAEVDAPAASGYAWLQGRYMQRDALVREFGAATPAGYDGGHVREEDEDRVYISSEMLALALPVKPSPALVIGSLEMSRFFLDIEVAVDGEESDIETLALVFDVSGVILAPGEELELPPVLLADGRDVQGLVERYADEVALEMKARAPGHVATGWCSWYYFANRVSEKDIIANLETMVATKHPAEYVQIDDGYQSFTGDWLAPNEKFPSGMGAIASTIRAAGYRPGLWLAPFVMHEDSAVLRDRPEIALKLHGGETFFVDTWLGRCAVLDCTHPAAEAWLRHVFRTVTREWRYEYLKLDALSYAAASPLAVTFAQPGTTAAGNLRRGLEIIREAVGDETFVLGCTCHFGPAIGLVDAMRVGPDVRELWDDGPNPSVKHAMRLTLQRNWMHNRWWANDPDCLIVRDQDTALSEAEVRFLATAIAVSGGMVVASDDLPKLSPGRQEMALALFPPAGVAARPYDAGEAPVPSAWRADLGDGRALVGILNWEDTARYVVLAEYLRPGEIAFDVWNARLPGMGDMLLRPHEGTLWQVSAPARPPRVVGDSGSLTYGALFQRQVSGRVQVRNDLSRARTIAIEARGQVFEVRLAPGEMRWFD